jgi:hypothetical protein
MDPRVAKRSAEWGMFRRSEPSMALQAETGSKGRLTLPGMCEMAYSPAERRSMIIRSR